MKKGIGWRDATIEGIHYTTVYKRFAQWIKIGMFKQVWKMLLDLYIARKLKKNKDWFKVLLIDSSMIKNIKGTDCKGRNHYDRNRFATKVSMICDTNGLPLCSTFYPANRHDSTTIEDTIQSIEHDILPDKRYLHTLVGDKGYLINPVKKLSIKDSYRMSLVTPYRKNQKVVLTKYEKTVLKQRIKIEHLFCKIDTFKRLRTREDTLLKNYEGLNQIAMSIITISKM